MKKARVFVAAVAVCLIAGGAVAAKSHYGQGNLFYCSGTTCVESSTLTTVNTGNPSSANASDYFTAAGAGTCTSNPSVGCNNSHPAAIYITQP